MGTNFYLQTKSKETRDKYFGWDYVLTDVPDWGYEQHIGKRSAGWLPLLQSHNSFKSVKELKALYDTGEFIISDEYGRVYDWKEFDKEFLQWNGGVRGAIPLTPVDHSKCPEEFRDYNMPDHIPVSHFSYANGRYASEYFTDEDGYEFTNCGFS